MNAVIEHLLTKLQHPSVQVDTSVLPELHNYTVYGKSLKDISAAKYKTLEDMHDLAHHFELVQAYRGRVIRIKTGHLPGYRVLKRLWSAGVAQLMADQSIGKLSPAALRDATLQHHLAPLKERIDDYEVVIETAGEVEKLLSNAYYTLRELRAINEAFVFESRRERGV